MKKQYIFLLFILILLNLLYLIISHKYKEYKINSHAELTENMNKKTALSIKYDREMLEYISTKAYKNKILKEEQSMKNKGETIVFITNEEKYNTYVSNDTNNVTSSKGEEKSIIDSMTNYEKWVYFLFNKDVR